MYTTIRNIAGDTFMTCKDCGHALSLNKMCEKPLQSATDILKHMATHNASHAFASVERVTGPEMEVVPVIASAHTLGIPPRVDRPYDSPPSPNYVPCRR